MSWFDDNAPGNTDQIVAAYQQYLGRTPSAQELQSHEGNPGGLSAVLQLIQQGPEAQAYAAQQKAKPAGAPSFGTDPTTAAAFVKYYASQPGANPSLANDPNYWIQKITSGALGSDPSYVVQRFMQPEGAPAGSVPGQMPANFGAVPDPYQSNPNAPTFQALPTPAGLATPYQAGTWNGGPPPAAPTLERYTLPTMAEAQNDPGYAFGLTQGTNQIQRAAASNGSILNPGTVQALNRYGTDYATTKYDNLVNRGLAVNQNNNAVAQTGFSDAVQRYLQQYGQFQDQESRTLGARQQNQGEFQTAVGNNQAAFGNRYQSYLNDNARTLNDYVTNTTTKRTAETDYWNRLNDLYTNGANLAGGSYKPGVGTA